VLHLLIVMRGGGWRCGSRCWLPGSPSSPELFFLPYYTFEVAARQDWLELVAFLAVAVAVGVLRPATGS
jgi:hypothetical protein